MEIERAREILPYLPKEIRRILDVFISECGLKFEEIRIRAGAPLTISLFGKSCMLTRYGGITSCEDNSYFVSREEVQATFMAICENSVYAYMEELCQGYITLKGGHRVGICGKTYAEGGKIKNFKEISSLNFRISRQILGVADNIIDIIAEKQTVFSTLIISPPQTGKTTLIRDIARQISNRGFKTAIADDRGELGAMYNGLVQNDVGINTDVIDSAPKDKAILMLLKTMSPDVIISDEIASNEDVNAICLANNTGVSVIATTHGNSIEDVKKRRILAPIFREGVFKQGLILSRRTDGNKSVLYTKSVNL